MADETTIKLAYTSGGTTYQIGGGVDEIIIPVGKPSPLKIGHIWLETSAT